MSDRLIYPSIDFFMYDLGEGLGQTSETVELNYRRFYRKIYSQQGKPGFHENLKYKNGHPSIVDAGPVELLEMRYLEMEDPLDGYYYPIESI